MKKARFIIPLAVVLAIGFLLHLKAISGNNLFFTVDQGRDAVYVREILEQKKVFLKGPETSIRGVFAGPLWYYFITVGYFATGGLPVGGVIPLILLNLSTTAILAWWIAKKTDLKTGLILAVSLQFFWPFYEASLWSFNPFPLVALSFLLLILLTNFLEGKKKHFFFALAIIFLAFNTHLAGAVAFLLFYIAAGFIGFRKKIISAREWLIPSLAIPAIGGIGILKQFITLFLKTKVVSPQDSGLGVFTGTNFKEVFTGFVDIIGTTAVAQSSILGLTFLLVTLLFVNRVKKANPSTTIFTQLTFLLITISFVFFGSNKGWREWHTVYIPPLLFATFILAISQLPKRAFTVLLSVALISQLANFKEKYTHYLLPSDNPSILYNEVKTVDWIFKNSEGQGFAAYNYTDTFYDYPYQYLFWWYGAKKYGYLPCEYSNYPLAHKELYVPGNSNYLEPSRSCDRIKFLIIQSDTNGEKNKDWIDKFRSYHELQISENIGAIKIEKYYAKKNIPNDFCIWRNQCNQ